MPGHIFSDIRGSGQVQCPFLNLNTLPSIIVYKDLGAYIPCTIFTDICILTNFSKPKFTPAHLYQTALMRDSKWCVANAKQLNIDLLLKNDNIINVYGIKISDCDHSCNEHEICSSVLSNAMVMCLKNVFTLWLFWAPLKIGIGCNFVTSVHTDSVSMVLFCYLLKHECCFFSFLLQFFFKCKVKKISSDLWWKLFLNQDCVHLFFDESVAWNQIHPLSKWWDIFDICLCPSSFSLKVMEQISCLARYNTRSHNHSLLVQHKDIPKLIGNRQQ